MANLPKRRVEKGAYFTIEHHLWQAETQTAETQKRNRPEFESVVLDCPHPVVQRLQVAKEKYPNLSASYFSTFASVLIGFDAS
jgi:hypothetical protein